MNHLDLKEDKVEIEYDDGGSQVLVGLSAIVIIAIIGYFGLSLTGWVMAEESQVIPEPVVVNPTSQVVGTLQVKTFVDGDLLFNDNNETTVYVGEDGKEYIKIWTEFCRPLAHMDDCRYERKQIKVAYE